MKTELEKFIKKIWDIFPEKNEWFIGSKALIFRGSNNPDEVLQVLEEYFDMSQNSSR